jgi:hypothetical protein
LWLALYNVIVRKAFLNMPGSSRYLYILNFDLRYVHNEAEARIVQSLQARFSSHALVKGVKPFRKVKVSHDRALTKQRFIKKAVGVTLYIWLLRSLTA